MDVILLTKVANLGNIGDRVKVKSGYGRNFLLPKGKATLATPENVKKFEARRAELEKIARDQFQDAEDLDGLFSGLMAYTGDPINGFIAEYENRTWQYAGTAVGEQGRAAATAQSGEQAVPSGVPGAQPAQPPPCLLYTSDAADD